MGIFQFLHCGSARPRRIEQTRVGALAMVISRAIFKRPVTEAVDERLVKSRAQGDVACRSFVKWESALDPSTVLQLITRYDWKVFCSMTRISFLGAFLEEHKRSSEKGGRTNP